MLQKKRGCFDKCREDSVKEAGIEVCLTFRDRPAGNDNHGQDIKEIDASHGWLVLGLAATLCRSSLSAPVCPLSEGQTSKQQAATARKGSSRQP